MDIRDYIHTHYQTAIGWGTSSYFDQYIGEIPVELSYLIDSNEAKWGEQKHGWTIKSPNNLMNEDQDHTLVIVFSTFITEIKETVRQFGNFDVISANHLRKLAWHEAPILQAEELDSPVIVTISRTNFAEYVGGTSKFIREQMQLIQQQGKIHLHVYWNDYAIKGYRCPMISVVKNGQEISLCSVDQVLPVLQQAEKLVIHNLIGLDTGVLDRMLESLPSTCKVIYYLHDYSCICSNFKLMHNDNDFCDAFHQQWAPCQTCAYQEDRKRIYEYHARLFNGHHRLQLIAPSVNVKKNISAAFEFDEERIRVIPHQEFAVMSNKREVTQEKIRIAYVGYKHRHKGWEVFKKIVARYGEKYDFFCLGRSDERLNGVRHVDVSFIVDGPLAMVKKLREHDIDIAFLWSLCPETYSYTYFESGAAGAFIVTNELSGNIAEQTSLHHNGMVLKDMVELYELLDDEEQLRARLSQPRTTFQNLRMNDTELLGAIS